MEAQPRTGSSSSSVAYPQWVMLEEFLDIKVEDDSSCCPTDDTKTLAAARTSTGRLIQVSLRLAEPPAVSRVCLRIPGGVKEEKSRVLAAHGDSVLIQLCIKEKFQQYYMTDHFVYNAGDPAADPARPPSLSLLPPYFSDSGLEPRELCYYATGLLRRGEDELVVAELTAGSVLELTPTVVELYLFRSGEWNCYNIEIREDWDLPLACWDTVVPVDDRLLCWVDLYRGVMLVDVFEETPRVQYVRLPMVPREGWESNQNVCATAGGGALKFINIFPRCCCGGAGASSCERSHHAYTIQTWMLRTLRMDADMEWVMDGMVDATELWALDAYKDLPCAALDRPIVSADEPEVICFSLREPILPIWQIMVNMRSKIIHSVSHHKHEVRFSHPRDKLIPSKVSYFFNTYPSSGGGDATTLTGQSQVDIQRLPAAVMDSSNPTLQQPSTFADPASVQAALLEMSEALQEIPSYGFLGPDEVKAYRILICSDDDGCRLRSFLRLPKDLRKDWLLMEIKTSDAN